MSDALASTEALAAPALRDHREFMHWMREQIGACTADGPWLALLFVDYDVVTRVDGALGLDAGDEAHACLAGRLRDEMLRPQDELSEIGRGQLACGLYPVHGSGVAWLAANKALRLLSGPIQLGDTRVQARPAIGIALCPEHGTDPERLLQRARIACRAARHLVQPIAEYTSSLTDPRADAMVLENRLNEALTAETLKLAFEPQFELASKRLVGAECQIQLPSGGRPPVTPVELLAAIESADLTSRVIAWSINSALRRYADFVYRGLSLRLGLRFPARCLGTTELPDIVDRALHTWRVQRGQLVLGFAGLAALGAREDALESLLRLRKLGVRLSIDEFGSADAAPYYLANVQFDEARLPLRHVRDLAQTPRQEKVARALIEMAHGLGLTVVAEGLSDEVTAQRLTGLGCDLARGPLLGVPLDTAGFISAYESLA